MCESYTAITTEASPLSFWLHRTLVTPANIKLEIPAVAAKWHGKRMKCIGRLLRRELHEEQNLETVKVVSAMIMRQAPEHPLGPQAGQEELKDLEKVGSAKGPSRTRIPQQCPGCLGADAVGDLSCQLAA